MNPNEDLIARYFNTVVCVSSVDSNGEEGAGTAFHAGDGIFVTARHVVEHRQAHTLSQPPYGPSGSILGDFYYHPDSRIDVAVFQTDCCEHPRIQLGMHLDDWMNDNWFLLCDVLILGYPSIPLSKWGSILATRGEVNGIVDLIHTDHPHFLLSTIARGGFSGAPVINEELGLLGMITHSLVNAGQSAEVGFQAAISVEPILVCMGYHNIVPSAVRAQWEETGGWFFGERNPILGMVEDFDNL